MYSCLWGPELAIRFHLQCSSLKVPLSIALRQISIWTHVALYTPLSFSVAWFENNYPFQKRKDNQKPFKDYYVSRLVSVIGRVHENNFSFLSFFLFCVDDPLFKCRHLYYVISFHSFSFSEGMEWSGHLENDTLIAQCLKAGQGSLGS